MALVIGATLRMAAVPLPGTDDQFAGWAHLAATRGAAELYRWAGAPEDTNLRRVDGYYAQGDYPPVALYTLGAVDGLRHRFFSDHVTRTRILPATVKALAILAGAGLTLLLFVVIRRRLGIHRARQLTLVYWLSPTALLSASVFGDIDTLFMLPALGALIAGSTGWPCLAGSLLSVAILTKPQALLVVPVVALAIWNGQYQARRLRIAAAAGAGALTAIVLVMPIAMEGAALHMILAVGSNTLGADVLSSATNLWWIVGHFVRVAQIPGIDFSGALAIQVESLSFSAFFNFEPALVRIVVRLVGSILPLAAIGWAVWTVRRRSDLWLLSATGAFIVHAYVALATQVHENHLFGTVPLLALAAAGRPRFLALAIVTSAIYAGNMTVIYGFGDSPSFPFRTLGGVDLTLVLAAANCAALCWHAVVFRSECADTRQAE
jgi:hypothetical protein